MSRIHADQFSGAFWEKTGTTHTLEFRLMRLEVYLDRDANGFRYEVIGARKLRSKEVFTNLELAKLQCMKKAARLLNIESLNLQIAIDNHIPF